MHVKWTLFLLLVRMYRTPINVKWANVAIASFDRMLGFSFSWCVEHTFTKIKTSIKSNWIKNVYAVMYRRCKLNDDGKCNYLLDFSYRNCVLNDIQQKKNEFVRFFDILCMSLQVRAFPREKQKKKSKKKNGKQCTERTANERNSCYYKFGSISIENHHLRLLWKRNMPDIM